MPPPTLDEELHNEMIAMYRYVGETTGYWGKRFLAATKRKGGLTYAKQVLGKRRENPTEQAGFEALIECNAVRHSLEALVLTDKYCSLFTPAELAEAQRRLDQVPEYANPKKVSADNIHPDDLTGNKNYQEGARKKVVVNAYERNPSARRECLKAHGLSCKVCGMNFHQVYGKLGEGFIHVHHLKPLAARKGKTYTLNPRKDLIPVCPNCHAMLHRTDPPMTVGDLKREMGAK